MGHSIIGKVVLIDNYDSFTYNLYQYILEFTQNVVVYRNDKISIKELEKLNPEFIVISPGPKTPSDAGISKEVIGIFDKKVKILGVCLGHQSINEVYGGKTIRAPKVCHGKTSIISHDGKTLFKGLPPQIEVARYHSLVVDPDCVSPDLEISAQTEDGIIMAIRHRRLRVEGVQFHPESFLTPHGKQIMENFFNG